MTSTKYRPDPVLYALALENDAVVILDQTLLPHEVRMRPVRTVDDAVESIRSMRVRGAPLIGATAAYGLALAMREDASDAALDRAIALLAATRPTAVNLAWALARMRRVLAAVPARARAMRAWQEARQIAEEDAADNAAIGGYGLAVLRDIATRHTPVRVMTHCNAGRLATVAHGTALAPVYAAHAEGIPVQVVVSETRPRNQGLLTAWELSREGVSHMLICDNAAGAILQAGRIDAVIVGADRIAANGDTANKVGTYLKALAARAAGVPFYVAAPGSTIDFHCPNGASIPIEERSADEVLRVWGLTERGDRRSVTIAPLSTPVANPAFDVTPAALITAIVCERGVVCPGDIGSLYPEVTDG